MPPLALSIRSAYVALTLHYVNSETLLPEGWFMLFRQDCGPCLLHEQKGQPWKKDCVCMDLFPQHVLLQCHVWGWPSQTAAIKSPKGRRNDHCARVKKNTHVLGLKFKKISVVEKKKVVVSFTRWWSGSLALAASCHFHSVRDLTLKSGSTSSCCKAFRAASSQLFCGSSLLCFRKPNSFGHLSELGYAGARRDFW